MEPVRSQVIISAAMDELLEDTIKFVRNLPVIGKFFEKRPKVHVLRLSGIIADSSSGQTISHNRLSKYIDKAFDKEGVEAVALVINCPGGSPAQTALIANHIRMLAEAKELPLYAFVEDIAASGGYWLACTADEIYAQETSIVGSIGVISAGFGFEDVIEQYGIHRRVHTSGKEKSFMDPFLPEKKSDIDRLKTIQKDMHECFIGWVNQRRGDKLKGENKDLFEGQFWIAGTAQENGVIDGIESLQHFARDKYGDRVKLVNMTPDRRISLPGFLGASMMKMPVAEDWIDALEWRAYWSRYGL